MRLTISAWSGRSLCAFLLGAIATTISSAQEFPTRPIRVITGGVGGSNDFAARSIAQGLTSTFGWQTVVDNRGATIAIELAAKAQPDGYTILVAGSSFIVGALMHNTPYDPAKDFTPITLALRSPMILVVHPSLGVGNVKALIDLAKSNPGRYNFAATSIDGAPRLAAELFKSMAGIDIGHRYRRHQLQGCVGDHQGSDRRRNASRVQHAGIHPASHQGGTAEGARGQHGDAVGAGARSADGRCLRPAGIRVEHHDDGVGAGAYARSRYRRAQPRHRPRIAEAGHQGPVAGFGG
jgi:hypothetical protein